MKWEYDVVPCSNIETPLDFDWLLKRLANKGQEGWELVSVHNDIIYFKRPLIEEQPIKEVD